MELIIPENSKIRELDDGYEIKINIKEGESKSLIIEYILDDEESVFNERDLENETIGFWKNWISRGRFFDFHRNDVVRSLITLKMMQFFHTGAMIAAPTTSLTG